MNVKLLRKIQKHILAEPRRFAMGIVRRTGKPNEPIYIRADSYNAGNIYENEQKFPSCGTMACIMGWGRLLEPNGDHSDVENMCSAEQWPKEYRQRYKLAKTPRMRARIAVQRIERYIKTEGRE